MPISSSGMGKVTFGPNGKDPYKATYATKKHKTISAISPLKKSKKKKKRK